MTLKKEKPEAFEMIKNKYGDFVFLGHSDDEILGAKKLGIITIGLKNKNADYFIENLEELKKLVESLK